MPTMFTEVREFFDGTLTLPIDGKPYVVPPLDAKTGLWVTTLLEAGKAAAIHALQLEAGLNPAPPELTDDQALRLNDNDERSLYERVLGPAYQQMLDDDVDWPTIARAGQTAILFFTESEDAARRRWEDVAGKARGPRAPQDRKAAAKKSTGSTSTTKGSARSSRPARRTSRGSGS